MNIRPDKWREAEVEDTNKSPLEKWPVAIPSHSDYKVSAHRGASIIYLPSLYWRGFKDVAVSSSSAGGQSDVLVSFKNRMQKFCKNHPGVHSAWIRIDHNHKNITVFTVTGDWDFDLEGEIFDGPYSNLPVVTTDGYYIEQRVTFLDDGNIEDVLPSGYERICSRDN